MSRTFGHDSSEPSKYNKDAWFVNTTLKALKLYDGEKFIYQWIHEDEVIDFTLVI